MGISQNFQTHLDSGTTTLARCWQIARRDGMVLGCVDGNSKVVLGEVAVQIVLQMHLNKEII